MAKKKKNKKKPTQGWKKYKIEGDKVTTKNVSCPKCGEGTYMAAHKDRRVCGKCGYAEIGK